MFPKNPWLEKEELHLKYEIKMREKNKYKKKDPMGIFYFFLLFFFLFTAYSYTDNQFWVQNKIGIRLASKWICPNCGYANYDQIRYCGLCGSERTVNLKMKYEDVGLLNEQTQQNIDGIYIEYPKWIDEKYPYLLYTYIIFQFNPVMLSFLISEKATGKSNAYISKILPNGDLKEYINSHEKIPLEAAQTIFYQWQLTEENYGF
jgi:ribosomal protein S27AE